jgi:acetoin utilization deacetylase AcuC-like enzyme
MALVHHPRYHEHRQTIGHPEKPERLDAVVERLRKEGLWKDVLTPEPVDQKLLGKVHTPAYIDSVRNFGEGYMDSDTYVRPQTYSIALLAAGGTVLAARKALETGKPAFALVRPPGHHAGSYHGGGFCYFNNVAVAAEALLEKVGKVAVVDIDLHHGNGTHDIFYSRKDVLYISTHQGGIYPGTGWPDERGSGDAEGNIYNYPLRPGCGLEVFEHLYRDELVPAARRFEPDIIFVSAGYDSHKDDPLGMLRLDEKGFATLATIVRDLATELCGGRLVLCLEGGYNIEALGASVAATIRVLQGG